MPTEMTRVQTGNACEREGCGNFARVGQLTCRWHDPKVLAAREEYELARQRVLRAAGAA